jgi:hypothetical protein
MQGVRGGVLSLGRGVICHVGAVQRGRLQPRNTGSQDFAFHFLVLQFGRAVVSHDFKQSSLHVQSLTPEEFKRSQSPANCSYPKQRINSYSTPKSRASIRKRWKMGGSKDGDAKMVRA